MKRDLYLDDLAEETGLTFETFAFNNYDMNDLVTFYMNSVFREACDNRSPWETTAMSIKQAQLINKESQSKNKKLKKYRSLQYDPILCAWIGEFYTYLQAYTGWSSKKIIEKYPFNWMYARSKGLHDLNPPYAVVKWVETSGIKERTGVRILPEKIKI